MGCSKIRMSYCTGTSLNKKVTWSLQSVTVVLSVHTARCCLLKSYGQIFMKFSLLSVVTSLHSHFRHNQSWGWIVNSLIVCGKVTMINKWEKTVACLLFMQLNHAAFTRKCQTNQPCIFNSLPYFLLQLSHLLSNMATKVLSAYCWRLKHAQ